MLVDMEKKQLQNALLKLGNDLGMSTSELAQTCGISSSTLTGFVNGTGDRANHTLSIRTINKISNKYESFRDFLNLPAMPSDMVDIPIIGYINHVTQPLAQLFPIEPNMTTSIRVLKAWDGCFATTVKHFEKESESFASNWIHVWRPDPVENIEVALNCLCLYFAVEGSKYCGWLRLRDGEFYLQNRNQPQGTIKLPKNPRIFLSNFIITNRLTNRKS